jgi:aryl-alcohol dehydrogenase-like predicted oxidoreductase
VAIVKDLTTTDANRLAIGTAQFGLDYGLTNISGRVSPSQVSQILQHAYESGITVLDTASVYGEAEKVLGDLGTRQFRVITKLPSLPKGVEVGHEWVIDQVINSASKLRRHNVNALLVHNPDDLRGDSGQELIRGLIASKKAGLTEQIGVSIYDPEDLEWILGLLDVDIVQAPMNVFDRRIVDSGWLDTLSSNGVETHVRSVFLQGSLVAGVANLPNLLKPWVEKFMEFETWANSEGLSLLEAALLFPLSNPNVEKVIIGVVSVDQLEHAVTAVGRSGPDYPDFGTNDQGLINPVNWTK